MSNRTFLLVTLVLMIGLLSGACAPTPEMEEPAPESPMEEPSGEMAEEPMDEEMEAHTAEPANDPTESESNAEEGVNAALTITGLVENEMAWTMEELKAMEPMTAVVPNKNGIDSSYTGVSLLELLNAAGVLDEATSITFRAEDGMEFTAPVEDILACDGCVVAFRRKLGGLRTAMPGFDSNAATIRALIAIEIN